MSDDADVQGGDLAESTMGALETYATGIPAPIRKNLFKSLNQLCTGFTEIGVQWCSNKTNEMKAASDARVMLTGVEAELIAQQMNVPEGYAQVAVEKFGKKILGKQLNLDAVSSVATEQLRLEAGETPEGTPEPEEISDDWLNAFEQEAQNMSSEKMRNLFGKILAGEIRRPSSYSIRTVKLLAQLDNDAAIIFQTLCSLSISQVMMGGDVVDARVVSLGNANSNSLAPYGLSFGALNVLQEYGLIIPDYNSFMPYDRCCITKQPSIDIPLTYQQQLYALEPTDDQKREFKVHGVAFTKSARELLSIIDVKPNPAYHQKLMEFFEQNKLKLVKLIFNGKGFRIVR